MLFSNVQNIDVRYFFDTANVWGVDYSSAVDQSNTIRAQQVLSLIGLHLLDH